MFPKPPPMSCVTKRSLSIPTRSAGAIQIAPDAGHLVVAVERPLARALVVLDERAGALERRRGEAVEVEPLDLHDVVGLGERRVDVAPVEDARPDDVRARVVVEDRLVLQRLLRVDEHGQRVVLDLDSSAASRASSRVAAQTAATGSPMCRTLPTASA